VSSGTYGSGTAIPVLTIDASGFVDSAGSVSIDTSLVADTTPQLGGDLSTNGNNILLGDNDEIKIGDDSDLRIYHDGSHSYIQDNGTGNLHIDGTRVLLRSASSANMVKAIGGGSVSLYHNNNLRLETIDSGIDVTGTVVTDAVHSTGNITIQKAVPLIKMLSPDGTTHGMNIKANVNNSDHYGLQFEDKDGVNRVVIEEDGDISFYESSGTTANFRWDVSANSLGIGTTSPQANVHIATPTGNPTIGGTTITNARLLLGSTSVGLAMDNNEVVVKGNNLFLGTMNADDIRFRTSGTGERAIITDSGNFGVGLMSPIAKVDASGTVYARGGESFDAPDDGGSGADSSSSVAFAMPRGQRLAFTHEGYIRTAIGVDTSGVIDIGQTGTAIISGINLKAGVSGNVTVENGNNNVDFRVKGTLQVDSGLGADLNLNGNDITGTGDINTTGTVTVTGNVDGQAVLNIIETDSNSASGPIMQLKRVSGTPAIGDNLGQLKFKGKNAGGADQVYGQFYGRIGDTTTDAECGTFEWQLSKSGTMTSIARLTDTQFKLLNGTSLDLTGALTTSSTIDGRDIAADGLKLDSIAGVTGLDFDSANGTLTLSTSLGTNFTDVITLDPFTTSNVTFNGLEVDSALIDEGHLRIHAPALTSPGNSADAFLIKSNNNVSTPANQTDNDIVKIGQYVHGGNNYTTASYLRMATNQSSAQSNAGGYSEFIKLETHPDLTSLLSTDLDIKGSVLIQPDSADGTVFIGDSAQTGAITIGNSKQSQSINIGDGANTGATTKVINIGQNGVATTRINLGANGSSDSVNSLVRTYGSVLMDDVKVSSTHTIGGTTQTGTITLGRSSDSNEISIGCGGIDSAKTQTINIGNGAVGTGVSRINIGDHSGTTSSSYVTIGPNSSSATSQITIRGNTNFYRGTVTFNGGSQGLPLKVIAPAIGTGIGNDSEESVGISLYHANTSQSPLTSHSIVDIGQRVTGNDFATQSFLHLKNHVGDNVNHDSDIVISLETDPTTTSVMKTDLTVKGRVHIKGDSDTDSITLGDSDHRGTITIGESKSNLLVNIHTGEDSSAQKLTNINTGLSANSRVNIGPGYLGDTDLSEINIFGELEVRGRNNADRIILGDSAQTGKITVGSSKDDHTVDIATGAVASGKTKTVNIGTGGIAGSLTNVTIGSSNANATDRIILNGNTFLNGASGDSCNIGGTAQQGDINIGRTAADSQTVNISSQTGAAFQNHTTNIGCNSASTGTKTVNIGTDGASGSLTNVSIGPTVSDVNTATVKVRGDIEIGVEGPKTTNTITIGKTDGVGKITLGQSTSTNTIDIGAGAAQGLTGQTINIGNNKTNGASSTINIGNNVSSSGVTQINIGKTLSQTANNGGTFIKLHSDAEFFNNVNIDSDLTVEGTVNIDSDLTVEGTITGRYNTLVNSSNSGYTGTTFRTHAGKKIIKTGTASINIDDFQPTADDIGKHWTIVNATTNISAYVNLAFDGQYVRLMNGATSSAFLDTFKVARGGIAELVCIAANANGGSASDANFILYGNDISLA
jgi:hypothetical protein